MFGELGGLLTKKATFLFEIEAQPNVNPGLNPATDAVEVSNPDWTTDVNVLQRDFVSNDLSPFEDRIGRIIAGFKVEAEIRGNGKQQSGMLADAPIIAKMIQACGFELYPMAATGVDCHSPVIPAFENPKTSPRIAWTSNIAPITVTAPTMYTIEVTTAGASGIAMVTVTSNGHADIIGSDVIAAPAPQVITTAVALPLGTMGGTITPVWAGALTLGMKWQVACFPRGIKAKPVSKNFKTAHMSMNRDGKYHRGGRGVGTFSVEAMAGMIAKATFNFTTAFIKPTDELIEEVDFGDLPLPPQVELSTFTWGGNSDLLVEKFTYDHANQVEARPSVNHPQGYAGSRITDRSPKIGFNPEATLEADHPFWDEFVLAKSKVLMTRIGQEVGNQVVFFHGKTQTSEQPYGDRNGFLTFEKSAAPKRIDGDDETIIVFC